MDTSEARLFLGKSQSQRRLQRRAQLIAAAYDLLLEGGGAAIGIRSVSQRAGLNTRYFYESFEATDDLLLAMLQELFADVLAKGMSALHEMKMVDPRTASDHDLLKVFQHGLRVALAVALDDPKRLALLVAANSGDGRLRQDLRRMVLRLAEAIAGDENAPRVGIDQATALFIAGGVMEVSLAHVAGVLPIDREALVGRLAQISLGAVKGRGTDSSTSL